MTCPVCGGEKIIKCVECEGKGKRFPLWPSRMKETVCHRCEGQTEIECPVCGGKGTS